VRKNGCIAPRILNRGINEGECLATHFRPLCHREMNPLISHPPPCSRQGSGWTSESSWTVSRKPFFFYTCVGNRTPISCDLRYFNGFEFWKPVFFVSFRHVFDSGRFVHQILVQCVFIALVLHPNVRTQRGVCMYACMYVCLSVCMYVCLSVCLPCFNY
jgi:hypothetical protein